VKKNTVTIVVLGIFAYTFFQMGYDILYKEFVLRKLIAMILVLAGTCIVTYSEIKRRNKERNNKKNKI
jgi:hypothetical protein